MRSRAVLSTVLIAALSHTAAQAAGPPPQPNAAQIALGLRKLAVVGSVLYVAAHPDDENTALLAYLASGAQVRVGYLSLTRGDGGQNLIGSEQGPALGLIRTQELLAARRIDGAEQFFTRARDFGYSKNPDETLRIWGKDAVLADVVSVIRRFRPDVIVTRFSPQPSDTHGHHTASAMVALEAFHAAADPHFHPEQIAAGLEPWQARRIFWNRSTWALKPGEDLTGDIKLDVDGYNPLLGASYGEIAADSRSMHKSQGFGIARSRAPIIEYFRLLASADGAGGKPPRSILDGIDTTWARFGRAGAKLGPLVARAVSHFDSAAPETSIPALAAIDAALDAVSDETWRDEKRREAQELMLACAGVFTEATASVFRARPDAEIEVTASAIARRPAAVKLESIRPPFVATSQTTTHGWPRALAPGASFEEKALVRLPFGRAPTTPYWLGTPPDAGLYHVPDPSLIGAPEGTPSLAFDFTFALGGRSITVSRAVAYKWTDPVMGERYRPFEITPAVSVRPEAGVLMFPGAAPQQVTVRLTAGGAPVKGILRAEAPTGWTVTPASIPFSLDGADAEMRVAFQVRPPNAGGAAGLLRFGADAGGREQRRGVVRIEHPHIPIQTYLVDADVRLVPIELATGGVAKVGYLPGPGDEVPASLRGVGYDVTVLGDEALAAGPAALARFDAVVIGVRAFNTSERLRAAHAALMAYVDAGGTLVVQYNTNNRLAPLTTPLGPWPFEIGQKRVTDETAPVTFASPKHPALTSPNAIGDADFADWVQERGLYFADKWDGRYEAPLAMHDPGEPALAGSLLWGRYGKGTFVYTGLAFFRQLPAGVPGAYRLFANLLAAGHARGGHAR